MKPDLNINGPLDICGYSDADYSEDNDTQKSVTGYIVIIDREVIAWHSWSKKTVTLSVTESGYSAITEVFFEMLFFRAILLFMEVVVEYPITVHVDNIVDVLLSDDTLVS